MKGRLKKVVAVFLSFNLLVPFISNAYAASYNPNAAVEYAKNHWNDGNGLCAEFVSNCLNAGGCSAWSKGCTTLVRLLNNGGYGKLTKLNVSSDGRISASRNVGKVSIGDPIFCYCATEADGNPYVHVYLCGGVDSNGNVIGYAHNNAQNDEIVAVECGYCHKKLTAVYAYQMNGSTSGLKSFTVSTDAAKNITENSADIPGSYYNPSGLKVTEYGIQYGTSQSNLNLKGSLKRNENNVNGAIPAYTLKNLSSGTTYYYRCYVVASGKTYTGDVKSFKTKAVLTVSTDNAVNITQSTAVISGSYHNPNRDSVTEYGIQYGTNKSSLNQTGALKRNETVVNGGIPAYTLKNLKPGTTYYYRCYVKAGGKTYVGATMSFTTAKAPEPATLSVSTSNISLDLSKNKSQTISLTLGGGLPDPCQVIADYSTKGVGVDWGDYPGGLTVKPIITGKQVGNYTIKFSVRDSNTKEIAVSKTVNVKVTAPTYTIKFDANGGSGAPSAQSKTYQKNLTIPATAPTRDKFKFMGWSTTKDGSVQYQPGQQLMADKNMTLYAVWEGGGYIGEAWSVEAYDISLEDEFLEVGDSTKIVANAILNTGKVVDWTSHFQFTSSDPSVAHVNGNSIEALKPGTAYIEGVYIGLDEPCRLRLVVSEPQPEEVWIDFAQHERTVYTDDIESFKIGFSTNASSDAEYTWTLTGDASVHMPSPDIFSGASSPTIEVNGCKAGEAVLAVQVQQDGQTATDSCVIRVVRREESVIEISPNPVITPASGYNQGLDISFSDEPTRCEVTLTSSATGEIVEEKIFTNFYMDQSGDQPYETSFSMTGLPDGDYTLKLEVEYEDGSVQNETATLTRYTEILGDDVEMHRVTVK